MTCRASGSFAVPNESNTSSFCIVMTVDVAQSVQGLRCRLHRDFTARDDVLNPLALELDIYSLAHNLL